jgi:hypothetical protein
VITPLELIAIIERSETDDMFGSRSIHATALYDDAQKDRRKLLALVKEARVLMEGVACLDAGLDDRHDEWLRITECFERETGEKHG